MFKNLSERLSGVFDRLTKQGALSDDDVKTALREVRVALLEADVSLSVARDFVKAVQDKATGQAVTKSVTPGQQVVKIVYDELVHVLAGEGTPGALKVDNAPAPILMVGHVCEACLYLHQKRPTVRGSSLSGLFSDRILCSF